MHTDFTQPGATRAAAARCLCLMAAAAILFELFYPGARPAAASLIVEPWDKLAHFVVYSALAGLLWAATGRRMAFAVVVVAVLTGALDELHQAGVPGRTADTMDFLADTAAVTATIGLLTAWTREREPAKANSNTKGRSCAA
jgi:VanZ family protein